MIGLYRREVPLRNRRHLARHRRRSAQKSHVSTGRAGRRRNCLLSNFPRLRKSYKEIRGLNGFDEEFVGGTQHDGPRTKECGDACGPEKRICFAPEELTMVVAELSPRRGQGVADWEIWKVTGRYAPCCLGGEGRGCPCLCLSVHVGKNEDATCETVPASADRGGHVADREAAPAAEAAAILQQSSLASPRDGGLAQLGALQVSPVETGGGDRRGRDRGCGVGLGETGEWKLAPFARTGGVDPHGAPLVPRWASSFFLWILNDSGCESKKLSRFDHLHIL